VVAHEVRVLGEVDGLEGEAAETLPPVDGLILGGGGAAAAGLGAPLTIHGVGEISPTLDLLSSVRFLCAAQVGSFSCNEVGGPCQAERPEPNSQAVQASPRWIRPKRA
jgi:hypothetical protein